MRCDTQEVFEKIIEKLKEELKLADNEKERCVEENHLQFYSAKGYANGIANAIEIVKQESAEYNNGWISCSERLPDVTEGIEDDECPEFNVTIKGADQATTLKCASDGTWFDDLGYTYDVIAWQPLQSGTVGGGRMTIDEAIAHAREVASRKFDDRVHCIKCAEEHEQLAEWLEELKQYRAIGTPEECRAAVETSKREVCKNLKTNYDLCCESIEAMAQIIDIAKIGWSKEQIMEWLQKEVCEIPEPCSEVLSGDSMTNADRIRSMSDEELAMNMMCPNENGLGEIKCDHSDNCNCYECILEWLKLNVED